MTGNLPENREIFRVISLPSRFALFYIIVYLQGALKQVFKVPFSPVMNVKTAEIIVFPAVLSYWLTTLPKLVYFEFQIKMLMVSKK